MRDEPAGNGFADIFVSTLDESRRDEDAASERNGSNMKEAGQAAREKAAVDHHRRKPQIFIAEMLAQESLNSRMGFGSELHNK